MEDNKNTKTGEKNEGYGQVTIYGIITNAIYGNTKFDKNDAYRISLKPVDGEMDKLREATKEAYKNVSAGFLPKWYQDAKAEYINTKSNYDITLRYKDDRGSDVTTSLSDILADKGSINGSKAAIVFNIKEGAIYPLAIKIFELAVPDFDSLFESIDEEELPF